MHFLKTFFTALLLILATGHNANADVKDHLGSLAEAVTTGVDGIWEAKLEGGWFNLINHEDPNAIKYFYIGQQADENNEWAVEVNVVLRGDGDGLANAGLVLNRTSSEEFFAFTISADGTANFITLKDGDFKKTGSDKVRAKLDGTDILSVRQTQLSLKLSLNGEVAFTLDAHDGLKFEPAFGIIAVGKGRFAFNGYKIELLNGDDAFPAPAKTDDQPFPSPNAGGDNTAPQQEISPEELYQALIFMGTTFGIFFHEFGHALIGETNLPATGPEEDTADGFSAFVLSEAVENKDLSAEEAAVMRRIAEYASLYWFYSGLQKDIAGQKPAWQDEHAPDLNRFRNSFCILYGSNPARYEHIATRVNFGERAKIRCHAEYDKRKNAWDTILKTVSRNLGPDSPGMHPADTPGGKILLSIQPSNTEVGILMSQGLLADGFMQETLQALERMFVWPRDLHIVFRDCEEINAWYDPETATVTMCYGIIEYASTLIIETEVAIAQGADTAPAAAPPPVAGEANNATRFLIGTWTTAAQNDQGQVIAQITYYDNGEYHSETTTEHWYMQTIGKWSAEVAGKGELLIKFNPVEWEPKQLCDGQGNCQPNNQSPGQEVVTVVGEDTVNSGGQIWSRTK